MNSKAILKAMLPRAVRPFFRACIRPIASTTAYRRFMVSRVSPAKSLEISNPNYLLHIGNIWLSLKEYDQALEFYFAACQQDDETRWVSGRSLLDYVMANRLSPSQNMQLLSDILNNEKYVVPDLDKYLIKQAVQDDSHQLAAILESTPSARLGFDVLVVLGSEALAIGRNQIALWAYRRALQHLPDDLGLREQLGVTEFLAGLYPEAEATFASADHQKYFEKTRWGLSDFPYRILDKSWLQAIGHVAFLDTYIKSMKLGWTPDKKSLLVYKESHPPAGWPLFKFFSEHIEIVPTNIDVDNKIDSVVGQEDGFPASNTARDRRRAALSQSFWYGPDGDGQIRWYGPLGAAVEAAWKAEGRPALFSLADAERKTFRKRMAQIYGLPEDAWFVLLHVREPGFHSAWHKYHAGTRNADISAYESVIDFVRSKGGWVVRGGDPSMKPIPRREGVIDYATSVHRSPEIDIYLCAECAYFVGTNSGFSLIPPVFGKRCALTNWSPIGIPNWYLDDIFIPKLVRKMSENRYLTYREMYDSFTGWSQFTRDFENTDFVIEDNSAEELLATAEELHDEVFGHSTGPTSEDRERLRCFNDISLAHGGYIGSRMSYRFMEKYQDLLDDVTADAAARASERT
jgi:putative glycosyltransferase (TIGR04372 family)